MNTEQVLITGGTGSLGNQLVKQFLALPKPPPRIVVFSRCEQKQEQMAAKFKNHPSLRFFLGDVRDFKRLEMALNGISNVIHAAALKIVPKLEYDPEEAVKTNIIGSMNVINACIANNVKRAVLVSTDKCVNPINLYGATKLSAEKLFVAANNLSGAVGFGHEPSKGTMFSVIRYGNVVNSRGSVIPFWRKCKAEGQPLPVTDLAMTRFWITLEESANLALNALAWMRGGEVFVPILPSFKVVDLAEAICPGEENRIVVGKRAGEKVHEVLLSTEELENTRLENNTYVIRPPWAPEMPRFGVPIQYTSLESAKMMTVSDLRVQLELNEVVYG